MIFKAKAKDRGPEAKAKTFKHTIRVEIHSPSDSLTGYLINYILTAFAYSFIINYT